MTTSTRRYYTLAEDVLEAALADAAAGEHPDVIVAELYTRAANPLDPGVAASAVTGLLALLPLAAARG